MRIIRETIAWSDVMQIENGHILDGGENGNANLQAKALANRTLYLKDKIEKLKPVDELQPSDIGAAPKNHAHPVVNDSESGFMLPSDKKKLDGIVDIGDGNNGKILAVTSDGHRTEWKRLTIGDIGDIRFPTMTIKENELKLNGAVLLRSNYPLLWEWANDNKLVISEEEWLKSNSVGFSLLSGLFSSGDNTSSFRLPDHRGLFYRVLDELRGVDSFSQRALGSTQEDAIQRITGWASFQPGGALSGAGGVMYGSGGQTPRNGGSGWGSGTIGFDTERVVRSSIETRVKNIGVYAAIRYK